MFRYTPEILRFHPVPPFIFPLQSLWQIALYYDMAWLNLYTMFKCSKDGIPSVVIGLQIVPVESVGTHCCEKGHWSNPKNRNYVWVHLVRYFQPSVEGLLRRYITFENVSNLHLNYFPTTNTLNLRHMHLKYILGFRIKL